MRTANTALRTYLRSSGSGAPSSFRGPSSPYPPRRVAPAGQVIDDVVERVGLVAYLSPLQLYSPVLHSERVFAVQLAIHRQADTVRAVLAEQFASFEVRVPITTRRMQRQVCLQPARLQAEGGRVSGQHLTIFRPYELHLVRHRSLATFTALFLHPGGEAQRRLRVVPLVEEVAVLVPRPFNEVAVAGWLIRVFILDHDNREREPGERFPLYGELKHIVPRTEWRHRLVSTNDLVAAHLPQPPNTLRIPDIRRQYPAVSTFDGHREFAPGIRVIREMGLTLPGWRRQAHRVQLFDTESAIGIAHADRPEQTPEADPGLTGWRRVLGVS